MKRIEKNEKIWVPGEEQEPGYEALFAGDEYDQPVALELTRPVLIETIDQDNPQTELPINPPSTPQMLQARAGNGSVQVRSVQYFAQCCKVAPDVIDSLHARDFNRIGLVVANFTD